MFHSRSKAGNIPAFFVRASSLPEAWEKALLTVWQEGIEVRTEYDRKDEKGRFLDPPSRDSTMIIEVLNPFAEPRIHKNLPGGLEELEIYRQEVVQGIHDHWVVPGEPDKWTYTYHERLFHYSARESLEDTDAPRLSPVDQMEYIVRKALEAPHSRRMQAITWIPNVDPFTEDPPCLQRLWFRILPDEADRFVLNLNAHWRSRDAYKAWFMNAFALTDLQKRIADEISERLSRPVRTGRYLDISDSFHIYGSYFKEVAPEIEKMESNPDCSSRSWRSDEPVVLAVMEEARRKLARDVDFMKKPRI